MSAVGQANVPVQLRRGSAVRCNRLLGVIVPLAPEYNMGGFLRRNELNAFVSQSAGDCRDSIKQPQRSHLISE
jgi:hypothetical protein